MSFLLEQRIETRRGGTQRHRRLRWKFRADMVCMIRFLRHPLNKMQLGKGQMAVQAPENYSACRVNKKCS